MRGILVSICLVSAVCLVLFARGVQGASKEEIFNAKVVEVEEINERDGLRIQTIKCEVLNGEYKGTIEEIQVPFDSSFLRPIRTGDRIKVSFITIGDERYFQFYDFNRSRSYIWLFLLFIVMVVVLLGWKGMKTLLPSFLLMAFLLLGIIPNVLSQVGLLIGSLVTVGLIGGITTWVRIQHKLLSIIVPFSVILCLLIAFLVFVGFSQTAYVVPFIGSIAAIDEDVYGRVLDFVMISIIFIPAGGVINASIQVAKYLMEKFSKKTNLSISEMLKEGLRISQKISAGELNNLIVLVIGMSLAGVYVIKQQYPHLSFWDNGWISLQVIYTISAGLSILLITPITVFVSAALLGIQKGGAKLKGQRRLRITIK